MAGSNPLVPRVPRGHAEGPRRALHRREWLRSRAWKSHPGQNRGGQPVLCPRGRYYLVLQGAGCQHNPADCRRRPVQACPWAGTCLRLTTSKLPAPPQCVLQEVQAPLLLEPAQGPRAWGPGGGEAGAARRAAQPPAGSQLLCWLPSGPCAKAPWGPRQPGSTQERVFWKTQLRRGQGNARGPAPPPPPAGALSFRRQDSRHPRREEGPQDPPTTRFQGPQAQLRGLPRGAQVPAHSHRAKTHHRERPRGEAAEAKPSAESASKRAALRGVRPRGGRGAPGLQVAQSRAVTARGAVGASLAGRQACGGAPCPPGDRRRPPGCGASGMQVAPVPCPLQAPHGPPGVGWGAAVRSCPLSPAGLQGVAQTALLYSPGGCAACTLRSRGGDPTKPSRGAAKSRPARGPLPGQRPWAPWRAAPHSSCIPSSPA